MMGIPCAGPSRQQRLAFCAQYNAAVRLLSAASEPSCPPGRQARLYRFLAALKLDDRHTLMLTRESANRNRAAGNNRCVMMRSHELLCLPLIIKSRSFGMSLFHMLVTLHMLVALHAKAATSESQICCMG